MSEQATVSIPKQPPWLSTVMAAPTMGVNIDTRSWLASYQSMLSGWFLVQPPAPASGGLGAAPAAPPPDPRDLVQRAIASMRLRAIDIGIVPEPGADRMGLIGLPTWMWVERPSAQTWGPISRTASAGGMSATVTARVARVVWDMGDGTQITCTGPGTPYRDSFGARPSPDCGHWYQHTSVGEPRNAWTVTATSHWAIQWSGAGQGGTVEMEFSRSVPIRIGEMQVLVTS